MLSATILPSNCFAQDKIDKLSDKVDKLSDKVDKLAEQMFLQQAEINKQIAELAKQTAVNSTDIKGLDKRFDILFAIIITSSSILFAGIFGLIGFVVWDRRTALKPIETSNAQLVKEMALLKEKEAQLEAKLQEKQLKDDSIFKKLFEKFPDLANIA